MYKKKKTLVSNSRSERERGRERTAAPLYFNLKNCCQGLVYHHFCFPLFSQLCEAPAMLCVLAVHA
uniref:Uncharacterized protein n=1 Tax=Anguilla anguilla TaxID=7936 RepID=A0A0E9WPT0_ANGAN